MHLSEEIAASKTSDWSFFSLNRITEERIRIFEQLWCPKRIEIALISICSPWSRWSSRIRNVFKRNINRHFLFYFPSSAFLYPSRLLFSLPKPFLVFQVHRYDYDLASTLSLPYTCWNCGALMSLNTWKTGVGIVFLPKYSSKKRVIGDYILQRENNTLFISLFHLALSRLHHRNAITQKEHKTSFFKSKISEKAFNLYLCRMSHSEERHNFQIVLKNGCEQRQKIGSQQVSLSR